MYSRVAEADNTLGAKFCCQQEQSCHFGLRSLILYHFFMILHMFIAPGQGQTAHMGQRFDVNRNVLSLHSFVASFKKMSLKSDFIHYFYFYFIYLFIYLFFLLIYLFIFFLMI